MNASQIASKTNLCRGNIRYRLRKLGYDTGRGVDYEMNVLREILDFSEPQQPKRKADYSLDSDIFSYFQNNKNNSIRDISTALNIPKDKVHYRLKRIFNTGIVVFESKMNYTPLNQL